MTRAFVFASLLLVLPTLAAAQGGGGSGAGGDESSFIVHGYIPINDPNCPADLSLDWWFYCMRDWPQEGHTIGEMQERAFSPECPMSLGDITLGCRVLLGFPICNAVSSVCQAMRLWGRFESTTLQIDWDRQAAREMSYMMEGGLSGMIAMGWSPDAFYIPEWNGGFPCWMVGC